MDTDESRSHGLQRLLEVVQGVCWVGLAILPVVGFTYGAFNYRTPDQTLSDVPSTRRAEGQSPAKSAIRGLNVSLDGQYLDIVHADMSLSRRDAHTGRELSQRTISGQLLNHLVVRSPDGVSAGLQLGSCLEVFDEHETYWSGALPDQHAGELVNRCSVCRERNLVAAVSNKGSLWLLEFDHGHASLQCHANIGQPLSYVELSPAGDRAALVTTSGKLLIWDVAQERIISENHLKIFFRWVNWSGDGHRVIAYGAEENVAVYQVDTGELIGHTKAESQTILVARLSQDGGLAAVADGSRILLWDVNSGRELAVLTGHADLISALQFIDEDRTLISGDIKGQLRRWSMSDQREIWAVN